MVGKRILTTTATALAVAFVVFSCSGTLSEAEKLDLSETPLQRVDSMFFIQTENGLLKMRVEAPVMEVYDRDSVSLELFPEGLSVFGYAENGSLETTIRSRKARHDMRKDGKDEKWSVFGNVVVRNIVKQETMETDTLYWDEKAKEIWTDCYIKMYSPAGFMQGFGMRSDDMARNAIIQRPFNSYGVVEQDSTKVVLDSVNFIGPFPPAKIARTRAAQVAKEIRSGTSPTITKRVEKTKENSKNPSAAPGGRVIQSRGQPSKSRAKKARNKKK